jgi:flavin reductase (DIM6/NTAB) family NADH-FMN oxidoreductase RutF
VLLFKITSEFVIIDIDIILNGGFNLKPNIFFSKLPMPVCAITSKVGQEVNSMTVAWSMPVSANPPLFAFAIKKIRHTWKFLESSKQFTVTFFDQENVQKAHGIGRISGREGNKLQALNVSLKQSDEIESPYIEDGYFAMECKVKSIYAEGDHELVVGKVLKVHEINNNKPLLYLSNDEYGVIDENIKKIDTKSLVNFIRNKISEGENNG